MIDFEAAWRAIQPIRGWLANRRQAELMWERAQQGRHVIEIGTYCGKSAILMAMAMKSAGQETRVYCVDVFTAANEELVSEDTFEEFLANVSRHGVTDWIEVVRGNSHDPAVAAGVPAGAALVYLDGGHSYEDVMADIKLWRHHVARGGTLLFHDVYDDGQFPGIRQAIRDARLLRLIGNQNRIAPDAAHFVRRTCGCGGW